MSGILQSKICFLSLAYGLWIPYDKHDQASGYPIHQ